MIMYVVAGAVVLLIAAGAVMTFTGNAPINVDPLRPDGGVNVESDGSVTYE